MRGISVVAKDQSYDKNNFAAPHTDTLESVARVVGISPRSEDRLKQIPINKI